MHKIHVRANRDYRQRIDPRRLRQAARATLARENVQGRVELTVVITGDDEIRALNRRYRGVDVPTDVLAFEGTTDAHPIAQPGELAYLGDVIISYPRAESQALSAGHAVPDELLLLVVHGVLHLLGHDHADQDEKRRMWTAQRTILRELAHPNP